MKALITGCGPSVKYLPNIPESVFIYGVNDSTRWITPDIRLILDDVDAFSKQPERLEHILGVKGCNTMVIRQEQWRKIGLISIDDRRLRIMHIQPDSDLSVLDDGVSWFCRMSPSTAAWLAFVHGYTDIGLIGVDMIDHRFLLPHLDDIEMGFGKMREHFELRKVRMVNLSKRSSLKALEKMDLQEWLDE